MALALSLLVTALIMAGLVATTYAAALARNFVRSYIKRRRGAQRNPFRYEAATRGYVVRHDDPRFEEIPARGMSPTYQNRIPRIARKTLDNDAGTCNTNRVGS